MEIQEMFNQAVADSKLLADKPDNETLLQMYSLYKQSTEGDNTADPPSNPFDFIAKAKFDAWLSLKGKSKTAAMQDYINLIGRLKSK